MSKRKRGRTAKAQSLTKVRPKAAHSGEHNRRANSKQARVLGLLRRPSGLMMQDATPKSANPTTDAGRAPNRSKCVKSWARSEGFGRRFGTKWLARSMLSTFDASAR
jgi:hypothetical protein